MTSSTDLVVRNILVTTMEIKNSNNNSKLFQKTGWAKVNHKIVMVWKWRKCPPIHSDSNLPWKCVNFLDYSVLFCWKSRGLASTVKSSCLPDCAAAAAAAVVVRVSLTLQTCNPETLHTSFIRSPHSLEPCQDKTLALGHVYVMVYIHLSVAE